jgi:acyl-CoA synthetase (AMP-forming)/AMP-acid ligase II/3-hydroxymyristoyl/3-hydroxydecanoyl-(acyl carrier protein) dehydratase
MSALEACLVELERSPREVALSGPLASSSDFLARVRAWQHRLAQVKDVGLFVEERAEFSAALLGAWLAGTRVVLAGDVLPATVARLRVSTTHLIGPFADALEAGSAQASGPVVLDPRARLALFTSGTTGEPVLLERELRHLSAEVASLEKVFGLGPCDVHATVSHQHLYGLLFTVLWPLASARRFSVRRVEYPEQLERELVGPSVLVTSPAHLKRLPEARWSLPLSAVFSSGGPLSDDGVRRSLEVLGRAPTEIYGSSETGGIAWRRRSVEHPRWTPLPGVEWRVEGDARLSVRSPHFDGGWFETSDRALATEGGFELEGRVDRIAKVEEKRVSLGAIERRVLETGLLEQARALTVEGPRVVVALVGVPTVAGRRVLEDGKVALTQVLRAAVAEVVERVAVPRRFRFVDALPVDARGKTTDAALRQVLERRRPLPDWKESSASRAVVEFHVDGDLEPLEGHFPQVPITPGVAQIDWVIGWSCEAFGLPARVSRLEAIKFQSLVVPGQTLVVTLELNAEKRSVSFAVTRDGAQCSSGRVVFAA